MNGDELTSLVQQRFQTLTHLMELSLRQIEAIDENRMSDLMRILSDKQPAISQLTEIAKSLSAALGDDPVTRVWSSESDRERCREQQQRCDVMHEELLLIEADSERKLSESRNSAQEQLERFDSGRVAANSYAQSQASILPRSRTTGGSLDLSSN